MDQETRELLIFRILEWIFPDQVASHSERLDGGGPLSSSNDEVQPSPQRMEAAALLGELNSMADDALALRIDEMIEAQHFLNHPQYLATKDDYEYWVKAAQWTLDQATLLLLGRRPQEYDAEVMYRCVDQCKAAANFQSLRNLLETWYWKPELPSNSGPAEFINWARSFDVSVPVGLKAAFDDLVAHRNTLLEPAKNGAEDRPTSAHTREKSTLLKLVLGMAKAQYAYDPSQRKSSATSQICDDLDHAGLSLSPKTIRKILKEAAEMHWEEEGD